MPSDNSEWLGYMTVVYVQSYRRRGLSVNAEILFYIIWSGIYLKYFFFYCHVFHYDFECTNIFFFFSQFIHPALKNTSALCRGFCVELSDMWYQLKAMSLVTHILDNNSVVSCNFSVGSFKLETIFFCFIVYIWEQHFSPCI